MTAEKPNKKLGVIVEARMSSSRLPGKIMMELFSGWLLTETIVARARTAKRPSLVAVATTVEPSDDVFVARLASQGIPFYRGSEDFVATRILGAATHFGLDRIVRLTGDNPFIDGQLIDDVVSFFASGDYDYVTTTHMAHSKLWDAERTFPRGVSVEVIDVPTLRRIHDLTTDPFEQAQPNAAFLERPNDFRLGAFLAQGAYASWRHPELRFTVDTELDLRFARDLLAELAPADLSRFSTLDAINLALARPDLVAINEDIPQTSLQEARASTTVKLAT